MIYQELDRCKINHFFSRVIGLFIVSCDPSESIKSGEWPFQDPSQRLWSKTFGPIGSVADLKFYHKIGHYLICNHSAIPSVHKNLLERRPKERCKSVEWIGEFGIMLSDIFNYPAEDEAIAVNHNVALDAFYLFVGIEAIVAMTVAPFDFACPVHRQSGIHSALICA